MKLHQFILIIYHCVLSNLLCYGQIGLTYEVTLHDPSTLSIKMKWQTEGTRKTILSYTPLSSDGQHTQWFKGLKTHVGIDQISHSGNQIVLQHQSRTEVSINYQVSSSQVRGLQYAAQTMINSEYFHALGHFLFLRHDNLQSSSFWVDWSNLPRNWEVFNSYAQGIKKQQIFTSDAHWQEAVFAAGIAKMQEVQIKSGKIRFYFVGQNMDAHERDIEEYIIDACVNQRKFWNEDKAMTDVQLAIFLPITQSDTLLEMTGIGTKNAFSIFFRPKQPLNTQHVQHLIYHEMMHHWIGQRLRMERTKHMPDDRWFTEGFTEYFSYLTELEFGKITPAQLCEIANEQFFTPLYSQLPLQQRAQQRRYGHFLDAQQESKYPYQAGFVYAAWLDAKLRCQTKQKITLQTIMERLMEETENQPNRSTDDLLLHMLYNQLGTEIVDIHHNVTVRGIRIPIETFVDCLPYWQLDMTQKNWPTVQPRN